MSKKPIKIILLRQKFPRIYIFKRDCRKGSIPAQVPLDQRSESLSAPAAIEI